MEKLIETKEILKKVRDRVEKGGWIKYALARTVDNVSCNPNDPDACKFCLLGALCNVFGVDGYFSGQIAFREFGVIYAVLNKHARHLGYLAADDFNDRVATTQQDVLNFIDDLINEGIE